MRHGCEQHGMIGDSSELMALVAYAKRVAASACNALITGETGTGKELVAQMLHANSPRSSAPMVSLNCAAIPDTLLDAELFGHEKGAFTGAWQRTDGRILEANRGTLFMDEIGEISLYGQAKLLRALETRQVQRLGGRGATRVDVRIVAATNQNLEDMVRAGTFRSDLYFRLNVARIKVPPLRERRADILPIARHFLATLKPARPADFTIAAAEALLHHDWPGNVRELKNAVEVALIHDPHPYIELHHLPDALREGVDACAREEEERQRIREALGRTDGNKSQAAKLLRWSRMTLYRKMARHSLAEPAVTSAHGM